MKKLILKRIRVIYKLGFLLLSIILISQIAYALDYPEAGDFTQGSKVWSINCARCHNMRNPTDMSDDQWAASVSHMRVRAGLTGKEARDVLTFLQNSNTRVDHSRQDTSEPATDSSLNISGKHIYENTCMACHGANGKGSLPGTPDFTNDKGPLVKNDSELISNIINGFQNPASLMPMPPKGGNADLTEQDIKTVLGYLRKRFSQRD